MRDKSIFFILRITLAFTFIYAAVAGFLDPIEWAGFFPPFTAKIAPATTLLTFWGIIEIILAVWIVFGRKIFIPSLLAALALAGLLIFDWNSMDIIFRDVGLLGEAVALAIWSYRK